MQKISNKVLSSQKGFTIVELLIVIVIIGILAAITVVAYSGITSRASDVTVQSDFKAMSNQVQINAIDNSSFPSASAITTIGLKPTHSAYDNQGNTALYCRNDIHFGFTGVSKSKKVITQTTLRGLEVNVQSWINSAGTMCTSIGIDSTSSGYAARWLNSSGVWY